MNSTDLYKAFSKVDEDIIERSEKSAERKVISLKRRVVLAVAAVLVVAVLMGAAAVKYYDSIQGWMKNTWEFVTGQEMSDGQVELLDSLSQDIGIRQTFDGVTVTVDSATVSEDIAYLLLRFEGLELTDGVMDGYMRSLNIETNPMIATGAGMQYRDLPDGTVVAVISLDFMNDIQEENVEYINVKMTMSDTAEIVDNHIVAGEEKWRFSFDLYPEVLETITLPDTQVLAKKLIRSTNEETEIPVEIRNVELTSVGFSCEYEFKYENDNIYEADVSLASGYDTKYFVAVMEDGSEIGCGEGQHVSWRDGTAYVVSNSHWIVPINLDEIVEIHIGDTVIPVK